MLLTIEKVLLLKGVPMFASTAESSLAGIAAMLHEVELPAGGVLMQQGEMGSTMYIVVEGQVSIEIAGKQVDTVTEGDVVGELAVLDPQPRSATVRAMVDCRLLLLEREPLFELMSERPDVTQGVVRFLIRRYGRRSPVAATSTAPVASDAGP